MTIPRENPSYRTDSVVIERLALVAIVVSGVAATAIWLYLMW